MKQAARLETRRLVKNGSIVLTEFCFDCGGSGPYDVHHNDYTNPYDVVKVCLSCHEKRHSVEELTCKVCNYTWRAKKHGVKSCPECKSRNWNNKSYISTASVVAEVKCKKCGYEWIPRVEHPKSCPECKTRIKEERNEKET